MVAKLRLAQEPVYIGIGRENKEKRDIEPAENQGRKSRQEKISAWTWVIQASVPVLMIMA